MNGQDAKEKGNAAFKAGDFVGAIGHYTAAILADRQNATYSLNRAAAYLKLGKNEDAERDCTRVLELDGKNVKGWFRRGQARAALNRLEDAKLDFEHVLQLEPKNDAAQQEVKKVTKAIQDRDVKLKSEKKDPVDIRQLIPTSSSAVPPRRRVPITIIDNGISNLGSSVTRKKGPPLADETLLQAVSSRPLDGSKPSPSTSDTSAPSAPTPSTSQAKKSATFKEAKQAREAQQARPGGGIFKRDGQYTLFDTRTKTPPSSDPASSSSGAPPPIVAEATPPTFTKQGPITPKAPSEGPKPRTEQSVIAPASAMNLFNFNRNWDSLRTPEARWDFLQQLPAASLPSLFKTSLEPSNLSSMLQTFHHVLQSPSTSHSTRQRIQEYLVNLTRVPRFGTVMLFMSFEERRLVKEVWEKLNSESVSDATERKAWGLV